MTISLDKCKLKKLYNIVKIDIDDKNLLNMLNNLGIKEGNSIFVSHTNYRKVSYLVNVIGINYALDKHICEKIWVNE